MHTRWILFTLIAIPWFVMGITAFEKKQTAQPDYQVSRPLAYELRYQSNR